MMRTICNSRFTIWLTGLALIILAGCQPQKIENHLDNYPYEKELTTYLEDIHQVDLEGETWFALIPIPSCTGCTADVLKICVDNKAVRPIILNEKKQDLLPYQALLDQLPYAQRDSTQQYYQYDTGIYGATIVRFNDRSLEFFREINTGNAPEVGAYIFETIE